MKKIITILIITSFGSVFGQIDNEILFDVNFDSDFNDKSSYELTPVLNQNTIFDSNRFGRLNSAIYFQGNDSSYIEFGTPEHLKNDTSFSISLWFKGGTVYTGDYELLFHKYDLGLALYDLNTPYCGGSFDWEWNRNAYSNGEYNEGYDSISWHHLVMIYDLDSIRSYRNGVLFGSESIDNSYSKVRNDNDRVILGKWFRGTLDEVIIYSGVIENAEIQELYNKQDVLTSLIIENKKKDDVVYPNPVSDLLKVNELSDLILYNLNGESIMLKSNTKELDVSKLNSGIYFLEVNNTQRYKVVKQ